MSSDFVDCACTLAVQFPDNVYRSAGVSVVLPELLKCVDVPKVRCVQFIRNGLVRVTFDDTVSCEAALSSGVVFRGVRLPVAPVSLRSRLVYVRDLPAEVPESLVQVALSSYGTVHSVSAMEHTGYPGLLNGTRLVKIVLEKDIPSSLHISGFECRVWYRGQPQACVICHSYRHRVRECPLNGLCRRCHQAGHVARECREPRRPSTVPHEPLSTLEADVVSDSNDVDFVPSDVPESSSSIAEEEELLVSGDENVLADATVLALPPRLSVPVSGESVPVPEQSVPVSPSSVPVSEESVPVSPSSVPVSTPSKRSLSPPPALSSPSSKVKSAKPRVSSPKSSVSSESEPSAVKSRVKFVAATNVDRVRPKSVTRHALIFKDRDSPCGASRFDFGHFTTDVIKDTTLFEYDRFVYYVHRGISRATATVLDDVPLCETLPRLRRGTPATFPGEH